MENIFHPSSAWATEGKFIEFVDILLLSFINLIIFSFQRQHLHKNEKYPHIVNVETNKTAIQQEALLEGKFDSIDVEGL